MAAAGETDSSMASASGEASNSNVSNMKTIVLISSDGKRFEVPEAAASLSQLVTNMIEDDCTDGGIRLHNVTADVLAKVVDYCNKHAAAAAAANKSSTDEELRSFNTEFLEVDNVMLFALIMAANYMNIKCLFNLACQRVADMMTDKSPEEIREKFGIENDFEPEEEAAIREETAWAFDKH